MESEMMTMIRQIRDKNSKKRMKMTQEAMDAEDAEIIKWFEQQIDRPLKTASTATPRLRHAR